jgi:hypothetical protein
MQRCASLFDLFCTGNFSTAETASYFNLYTFCAHAQCGCDGHFDSTFVVDTVFDLASNSIANDHCIEFGTANLKNIDLHIFFASQFLQFFFYTVNFAASLTYDNAGLGSMNGNDQLIQRSLDDNLRNTTFVDTRIQVGPDFIILDQLGGEIFFVSVPVAFPTADDS